MCWGWLQRGKRRKHSARRESPCPLVIMAALQRRAWEEREASFILWALWKKQLESPSSFAVYDPRRLRASGRDGGGVMKRPPSPLTMLLSRHTRRREFIAGLGGAAGWPLLVMAQQQTKPTNGRGTA